MSGVLRWNLTSGRVNADLTFAADDETSGQVRADWNDHASAEPATLAGQVGGKALAASMPAP